MVSWVATYAGRVFPFWIIYSNALLVPLWHWRCQLSAKGSFNDLCAYKGLQQVLHRFLVVCFTHGEMLMNVTSALSPRVFPISEFFFIPSCLHFGTPQWLTHFILVSPVCVPPCLSFFFLFFFFIKQFHCGQQGLFFFWIEKCNALFGQWNPFLLIWYVLYTSQYIACTSAVMK